MLSSFILQIRFLATILFTEIRLILKTGDLDIVDRFGRVCDRVQKEAEEQWNELNRQLNQLESLSIPYPYEMELATEDELTMKRMLHEITAINHQLEAIRDVKRKIEKVPDSFEVIRLAYREVLR